MSIATWCRSISIPYITPAHLIYLSIPDSQQYSSWNRNRRLRNSTQAANNNSQAATVMAQQNQDAQADGDNGTGKDKRSGEPLFGPSIGAVSNGPAWTLSSEKKVVTDELTQDIVNLWIEKSKEVSPIMGWSSLLE